MSSIITLEHNFIRNGVLLHRDLQLLWKAPEFRDCRPLLLSLLQHFEVEASAFCGTFFCEPHIFYFHLFLTIGDIQHQSREELDSISPL